MDVIIGTLALVFLYSAVGAAWMSEGQRLRSVEMRENSGANVALSLLFSCIAFCLISPLSWYWNVMLSLLLTLPVGLLGAAVYIFIAGLFSARAKHRISIYKASLSYDATLLMIIGIFLFVLFCFL